MEGKNLLKKLVRIILLPFFLLGLVSSRTREKSLKIIRKDTISFIFLVLIISLFLLYKNSLMVLIIILIGVFLLLFLFQKKYDIWITNVSKTKILVLTYIILALNMILGMKVYSVKWAFLGFVISAVMLYDSKIDSRFLMFPALLLLGYIPFLLIGIQKEIAENVAIYVYYFLIIGIILQIIEYSKKTQNSIDFNKFIETFINKEKTLSMLSIWGVITVAIIILNRFHSVELFKWSSVYIFVLLLVFYAISYFQEQQYMLKLKKK